MFRLSEDWLATLTGLLIVLVIGAGVFGPGPHSEKFALERGQILTEDVHAVGGWTARATVDGVEIPVSGFKANLKEGVRYVYVCEEERITLSQSGDANFVSDDHAQLVLMNKCSGEVVLSLTIDAAIRWPIFGLFD